MVGTSARGTIRRKSSGDVPHGTTQKPSRRPGDGDGDGDRISALPDDIIRIIFRSLPFHDAVKTSVLSKRWRSTWTTTATHLAFDGSIGKPFHDTLDFTSFVRSIRTRFTSPTVKRFHVTNLTYNEFVRSKLDSCLGFVKERNVEEIRLWLSPRFLWGLPASLYCFSSLVSLEVSSCRFSLDGTISWPRLKVLSIERVVLSEDVLKGIFMASPLLESLKLCECSSLKNIIIDATSLKELVLVAINYFNVKKIWAPHLPSSRVSGDWWPISQFRLDDVSSLVEAHLDFVFHAC